MKQKITEFDKWLWSQNWPIGTCAMWVKRIGFGSETLPGIVFARITEPELIALRKLIEVAADDVSLHQTSGVPISVNGHTVGVLWCARNGSSETLELIKSGTITISSDQ